IVRALIPETSKNTPLKNNIGIVIRNPIINELFGFRII
ncbi:unnamed protein product, partial [marine sediment metagenome]